VFPLTGRSKEKSATRLPNFRLYEGCEGLFVFQVFQGPVLVCVSPHALAVCLTAHYSNIGSDIPGDASYNSFFF
jgi:hypothetical protein